MSSSDLVERLCRASVKRYFIPELDIAWDSYGSDPTHCIVPESLISLYGMPEYARLTPLQRARLARHEVAALYSLVIRLENVLMRNFSKLVQRGDPTSPDLRYYMHEVEEEARHNRMFMELIDRLGVGSYPARGLLGFVEYHVANAAVRSYAMFLVLTLGAEALADFFHFRCLESKDVDALVRRVSLVHRVEEARHIVFAEDALRRALASCHPAQRAAVRVLAPGVIRAMFDIVVPPAVYLRSGVVSSGWQAVLLWRRALVSEHRTRFRRETYASMRRCFERLGLLDSRSRWIWKAVGLADDGAAPATAAAEAAEGAVS